MRFHERLHAYRITDDDCRFDEGNYQETSIIKAVGRVQPELAMPDQLSKYGA